MSRQLRYLGATLAPVAFAGGFLTVLTDVPTYFQSALDYTPRNAGLMMLPLRMCWKGAKITQPSFYVGGKADGLGALYPPLEKLRAGPPPLSWGVSSSTM